MGRHHAAPHGGHRRAGRRPAGEDLAARALAILQPYTPLPRAPVYHVRVDDQVVLAAGHDLTGSLLDLVIAVLAMGDVL